MHRTHAQNEVEYPAVEVKLARSMDAAVQARVRQFGEGTAADAEAGPAVAAHPPPDGFFRRVAFHVLFAYVMVKPLVDGTATPKNLTQ